MLEFYNIVARKIFFPNFLGGSHVPFLPSLPRLLRLCLDLVKGSLGVADGLRRGVEVCQDRSVDELYRRRWNAACTVQHDPDAQVLPLSVALGKNSLSRIYQRYRHQRHR